jgi:hypothetical protein
MSPAAAGHCPMDLFVVLTISFDIIQRSSFDGTTEGVSHGVSPAHANWMA